MSAINQSVGQNGVNRQSDVRTVQSLLNQHCHALALAPLQVDGRIGERTIMAIRMFQTRVAHVPLADGRVDPGGRTWQALNRAAAGLHATALLSGAAWWHANQARFPNSAALSDLAPGFAAQVNRFLAALRKAGAEVDVSATRRNKVRVYLMHYSWKVAKGSIAASAVPAEAGCAIDWNHGTDERSRSAAQEMVDLFETVYLPSLISRHIAGLAIDMTISWNRQIRILDALGKEHLLSSPANGSNTALHAVGASFGVMKLASDPPHWSDNGH